MYLVIYDIDGTLTDTNNVDELCYVQAVREVLKIPDVDSDWNHYRNVTDQGVAEEIIEQHGFRGDHKEAAVKIKRRFLDLLQ
jgi:beta-phosphoglucomutase-like phosphatase (HAD superfamily)